MASKWKVDAGQAGAQTYLVEQIPTEVSHIPGPVLGMERTTSTLTDIYP